MRAVCKKCGVEHLTPQGYPACKAHTKRGACRANPVRGATVCSKHNGMNAAVRRKAAERVAEAKVERTIGDLLAQHDIPDQHPFVALLDLSRRMGAMTRMLEQLVSEHRTEGNDEALAAAMNVYERFGRLHAQVSKTVLDANIDERMAKINEAAAEHITVTVQAALRVAMHRADLLPAQMSVIRDVVADELRALPQA